MPRNDLPKLFVVDGSNIATEGRSAPSLEQLNEAVLAFLEAHPSVTVTVVVDATFGHRIAKKEVKAFDEAVANNELVTPPAGAVGRGDAFVLAIADRAKAGVLSNDSFQEFHGEYEWLFDDGRLIGGKPVPHVGWVFVARTPVRGPKSRQAIREANDDSSSTRSKRGGAKRGGSKKAAKAAEPAEESSEESTSGDAAADDSSSASGETSAKRSRRGRRGRGKDASLEPAQQETIEAAKAATPKEYVNELMPFLEFVERHPVGSSVSAVVDSYSSHGAYAKCDDALVYIPLRLMDDPAPRSARSVLAMGDAVTVVIVGYVPDRRSIDAALPHMAGDLASDAAAPADDASSTDETGDAEAPTSTRKRSTAKKTTAKKTTAKKTTAKKATAAKKASAGSGSDGSSASGTSTAKKTAAKKTTAKKSATKKTSAATTTAAKKTAAKKAPAKKTAAKKAPAKKTAAKKTAAKKSTAKKTGARKTGATKSAAAAPSEST